MKCNLAVPVSRCWLVLLVFSLLVQPRSPVWAQISPDRTLPNNSTVTRSGKTYEIRGGTSRNGNLFHSFRQFSIPTGNTAFFDNDTATRNIFARVTGASISDIDGLIRANGSANLFLLNPNGILFGPNARLNIGGSFLSSTANSIQFADGREFSATAPTSTLLTVSTPIGLQYGANAGPITVRGPGSNLRLDPNTFAILRDDRIPGLQVNSGQTLALLGGDVRLQGGNLTAEGGQIELGSLAGEGLVLLNPNQSGWNFNYSQVNHFGNIHLGQAASADVSGEGGGNVHLQGRQIQLADGASVLSMTTGSKKGGALTLDAIDSIDISGVAIDPESGEVVFGSSLYTDVAPGASGRGSDLNIQTSALTIANGGQVSASTLGSGNTGNINVNAGTIDLISGAPTVGGSGIFANVNDVGVTGSSANVDIRANQLSVLDGAAISASTFGTGNAGNLRIKAHDMTVSGTSPGGTTSGLFVQVEQGAAGAGGRLEITTDRLQVTNGGQILAATNGSGDAGNLVIQARDIELQGFAENGEPSLLAATVSDVEATGQGGNLLIDTTNLRVLDGAQIAVATRGPGNAGDLKIQAEQIELAGESEFGRSGLFATAIVGTGAGGNIQLKTEDLSLRDGATISASNFSSRNPDIPPGQGPAGNIEVVADSIQLDQAADITTSATVGRGGSINLQAQTLLTNHGGVISTNSQGREPGGNITLNTDFISAFENSDITANAVNAQGGRIIVSSLAILGTEYRAALTPLSDITATSELGPAFSGTVEINLPNLNPVQGLTNLSTKIDSSPRIVATCERLQGNEMVITGRGGLPTDASQLLRGQHPWQDTRVTTVPGTEISGSAENSSQIVSTATTPESIPLMEAQGWVKDEQGQIQLLAQVPEVVPQSGAMNSAQCGSL